MREGEDEGIRMRDLDWRAPPDEVVHCVSHAFQWLPRGICWESVFNRFVLRQSREKTLSAPPALVIKQKSRLDHCNDLFAALRKTAGLIVNGLN